MFTDKETIKENSSYTILYDRRV